MASSYPLSPVMMPHYFSHSDETWNHACIRALTEAPVMGRSLTVAVHGLFGSYPLAILSASVPSW